MTNTKMLLRAFDWQLDTPSHKASTLKTQVLIKWRLNGDGIGHLSSFHVNAGLCSGDTIGMKFLANDFLQELNFEMEIFKMELFKRNKY